MNHEDTKTRRESETSRVGARNRVGREGGAQSRSISLRIGIVALVCLTCQDIYGGSLDAVVETVSRLHPVAGIDASGLSDSASVSVKLVVIFDVREVGEFDMSHLKGAVRVDPDVGPDAFLKQHGELLKDRTAVFYCSVGYRSSLLVERLVDATGDSTNLVNLRGGIFKWYNEGLAVYDSAGVTDEIHPFSAVWGRLLEKRTGKKNVPAL